MIDLTSEEFLKGIRHLSLVSRYEFAGLRVGERKTRRKGSSVEFVDYKEYNPGDDIRFLDWNLWARLDKFYLKLFASEENLNVFFLFDLSQSMRYGKSSKWDYQLKFIASIAYLSLMNQDAVSLYPCGNELVCSAPRGRQPGDYRVLVRFLQELGPTPEADPLAAVDKFLSFEKRKGILFLMSDCFYDLDTWDQILKKLRWYKIDTSLIQILAEEEINPPWYGPNRLLDSETGKFLEVDLSTDYKSNYQETCEEHTRGLETLSRKYGFQFARAASNGSLKNFITSILRRGSLT